jgi:hypothetical protein
MLATDAAEALRCMSPDVALFGCDRRVGECLLLREERKSGLRGPISVLDPEQTSTARWFNPMLMGQDQTGQTVDQCQVLWRIL